MQFINLTLVAPQLPHLSSDSNPPNSDLAILTALQLKLLARTSLSRELKGRILWRLSCPWGDAVSRRANRGYRKLGSSSKPEQARKSRLTTASGSQFQFSSLRGSFYPRRCRLVALVATQTEVKRGNPPGGNTWKPRRRSLGESGESQNADWTSLPSAAADLGIEGQAFQTLNVHNHLPGLRFLPVHF